MASGSVTLGGQLTLGGLTDDSEIPGSVQTTLDTTSRKTSKNLQTRWQTWHRNHSSWVMWPWCVDLSSEQAIDIEFVESTWFPRNLFHDSIEKMRRSCSLDSRSECSLWLKGFRFLTNDFGFFWLHWMTSLLTELHPNHIFEDGWFCEPLGQAASMWSDLKRSEKSLFDFIQNLVMFEETDASPQVELAINCFYCSLRPWRRSKKSWENVLHLAPSFVNIIHHCKEKYRDHCNSQKTDG